MIFTKNNYNAVEKRRKNKKWNSPESYQKKNMCKERNVIFQGHRNGNTRETGKEAKVLNMNNI